VKSNDVVFILNSCLEAALVQNASDVHIETKADTLAIKFRVDGQLIDYKVISKDIAPQIFSRLKVLIKADITKKYIPQEGRFSFGLNKFPIVDIRVIIIPTILGERATMRILHRNDLLRSLPSLGMHQTILQKYSELLRSRHGLILISGSTGSGKTTTLYASLLDIKAKHKNIITVEDPVEYVVEEINQIQFNKDSDLSFASCLRYILRMDPDIIFIGEIRDAETAALACSAALTGHLVVATIHTNDSISAITRLYDMGVEPFMIAHSLVGVVSQTLLPKVCMDCMGEGCESCMLKGVKGRIGVFELLVMNEQLKELVIKPPYGTNALKKAAREDFYVTLIEEATLKLNGGIISEKEFHMLALS